MIQIFGNFIHTHTKAGENIRINISKISTYYRGNTSRVFIVMANGLVYEVTAELSELDKAIR